MSGPNFINISGENSAGATSSKARRPDSMVAPKKTRLRSYRFARAEAIGRLPKPQTHPICQTRQGSPLRRTPVCWPGLSENYPAICADHLRLRGNQGVNHDPNL